MTPKLPNLRHLRALSEVAALRNISAAADRVFISQSALTQAIKKLEAQLNCPLFLRRHSGLEVTNEGQLFIQRVNRCLYLLHQGVREALRMGSPKIPDVYPSDHPAQLLTNPQLRALTALQRAPSYSAAARTLSISQPAVYKAASDLENGLNLKLFISTHSGVELTKAAHELAGFTRLALREIELGFDELGSLQGSDTTTITVGVVPLARTNVLPKAINQLTEIKPELKIKVVDGAYDDLLLKLVYGDIDLLISTLADPPPADSIVQLPLFNTAMSLVARQGHPLQRCKGLTAADLMGFRWVLPRSGTPARDFFDQTIARDFPSALTGAVESGSQIVTREILAGSDRLSFLTSYQIRHDEKAGLLTELDTDLSAPYQTVVLTLREEWQPTPPHLLFMSIIKTLSEQEDIAAHAHLKPAVSPDWPFEADSAQPPNSDA